jgi:hypothetical protein
MFKHIFTSLIIGSLYISVTGCTSYTTSVATSSSKIYTPYTNEEPFSPHINHLIPYNGVFAHPPKRGIRATILYSSKESSRVKLIRILSLLMLSIISSIFTTVGELLNS